MQSFRSNCSSLFPFGKRTTGSVMLCLMAVILLGNFTVPNAFVFGTRRSASNSKDVGSDTRSEELPFGSDHVQTFKNGNADLFVSKVIGFDAMRVEPSNGMQVQSFGLQDLRDSLIDGYNNILWSLNADSVVDLVQNRIAEPAYASVKATLFHSVPETVSKVIKDSMGMESEEQGPGSSGTVQAVPSLWNRVGNLVQKVRGQVSSRWDPMFAVFRDNESSWRTDLSEKLKEVMTNVKQVLVPAMSHGVIDGVKLIFTAGGKKPASSPEKFPSKGVEDLIGDVSDHTVRMERRWDTSAYTRDFIRPRVDAFLHTVLGEVAVQLKRALNYLIDLIKQIYSSCVKRLLGSYLPEEQVTAQGKQSVMKRVLSAIVEGVKNAILVPMVGVLRGLWKAACSATRDILQALVYPFLGLESLVPWTVWERYYYGEVPDSIREQFVMRDGKMVRSDADGSSKPSLLA